MTSTISIINATHSISESTALISTPSKKSKGTFVADLTYIGPNFVKDTLLSLDKIDSLIESRVLEQVATKVHRTDYAFQFNKHGFEFIDLSQTSLHPIIESLATDTTDLKALPPETTLEYERTLEEEATRWGKNQSIEFDVVACLDSTYRNTDPTKNTSGAASFVHLDFQTLQGKEVTTLPEPIQKKCFEKFSSIPKEHVQKYTLARIVNIWMPLDAEVEAYPLAVMDSRSSKEPLQTHSLVVEHKDDDVSVLSITASKTDQWYIKDAMKRGEAIVFDSEKTPHTAVSLPDQGEKNRRSVECRLFFMRTQPPENDENQKPNR